MKERMYSVVRFLKNQNNVAALDYKLSKNDIIKMGRVKLKIKHIHIEDKVKIRNKKLKRRKERVENEKEGEPSKYPEGYLDDPL